MLKRINKKGFTLIEIVLAIALLVIALGGIAAIIIGTKNNSEKLFTQGDLQQQLVEMQDTLNNDMLATNTGMKFWVRASSGDSWEMSDGSEDHGEIFKLFAIYNVDYSDYVLKKSYLLYNGEEKILYKAEDAEQLDTSVMTSYERDIDPDPQTVIDSLGNKWTVSSLNVKSFNIDTHSFRNKRLIMYKILVEQDDVEYVSNDTVHIRNDIRINSPFLIESVQMTKIKKPSLQNISFGYDGEMHAPTELNFNSRYIERVAPSTLEASEAGHYTITYHLTSANAQWEDGTRDDIQLYWDISSKVVNIFWGVLSWPYDGQVHHTTCEITSTIMEGDECSVELQGNSIGPAPGVAHVTASLTNPNYRIGNPDDVARDIQIVAVTAEFSVKPQAISPLTYNGSKQPLITSGATSEGTILYRITERELTDGTVIQDETEFNNIVPGAVNAGKYTIEVYIKGDAYHTDSEVFTLTSKIDKVTPKITAPTPFTLTYNGKAQLLCSKGSTSFGTLYYRVAGGKKWDTEIPSATIVGKYEVEYYVEGDSNVSTTSPKSIMCEIQAVQATWSVKPDGVSLTYNGKPQEIIIGAETKNGIPMFSLDGKTFSSKRPTATDVGKYTIVCYIKGDENYADSDTIKVQSSIKKSDPVVTPPKAVEDLIYNSKSQVLITAGSTTGGTLQYKLGSSGTWGTTLPTAVNAGTYTVYYRVVGDDNYNSTAELSISATISKAFPEYVTEPTAKTNLTYNASQQILVNNGSTNHGTILYSVKLSGVGGKDSFSAYSTSAKHPGGVNAGTYEVKYYIKGDSNHTDSAAKTLKVSIAVAKTASYETPLLTYNGSQQTGVNGTHVTITGTYQATNAGTYTAYATPEENYAWSDGTTSQKTISWSIKRSPTASYTSSNPTYTGSQLVGVTATNATRSGTYQATNVGSYTAYVTPKANYAWSDGTYAKKTITWSIVGGTITVTASDGTWTYDGTPHSKAVTATPSGCTIKYKVGTSGSYSTAVPTITDVGSKTVYYEVTKTNYQTATGSFTITVTKATPVVTAPTAKNLTYNGNNQVLINAGSTTGGTLQYKLNSTGTWGTSLPSAKDAKTYTVYYRVVGNENYNDVASKSISVTIKPASATGTNPTAKNLTWNNTDQALVNAGTSSYGTYYYSLTNGSNWSTTIPKGNNAGSYTVYYYIKSSNSNYNDSSVGSVAVTINKATTTITPPTGKSLTYNGSDQTLINAGSATWGTLKYCLTQSGTYSTTLPKGKDAKTYTVYYKVDGTSNYNGASGTVSVTIKPSRLTFTTLPTANNLTYNGSNQNLITAGTANNGTVKYSIDGGNTYTTTVPKGKNAGTYTVEAYVESTNSNYSDSNPMYITVTIKKATASYNVVGTSFTYTGSTITAINNLVGCTATNTSAVNVGSYTSVITLDSNHIWSDNSVGTKTVSWSINGMFYKGNTYATNGTVKLYSNAKAACEHGSASETLSGSYKLTTFYTKSYQEVNGPYSMESAAEVSALMAQRGFVNLLDLRP